MTQRTSIGYQFTTYDETDPAIAKLKLGVRIENAVRRAEEFAGLRLVTEWQRGDGSTTRLVQRKRVLVRGRLGKNNPFRHLYAVGGPLHRYSAQTIRPEHATRFDVYINETTVTRKS